MQSDIAITGTADPFIEVSYVRKLRHANCNTATCIHTPLLHRCIHTLLHQTYDLYKCEANAAETDIISLGGSGMQCEHRSVSSLTSGKKFYYWK